MSVQLLWRSALDNTGFFRSLADLKKQSKKTFEDMSKDAAGELKGYLLGGIGVAAVVEGIREIAGFADEVGDLADQFGRTTDEIQKMMYVANSAGVPIDRIAGAIDKIGSARQDALGGDTLKQNLFGKFGVSQDMLKGRMSDYDLAQVLANNSKTSSDRSALGDLLGEKGKRVINALQQLKDIEAPDLITEETIKRADKLDKFFKTYWQTVKGSNATMASDIFGEVEKENKKFSTLGSIVFGPGIIATGIFNGIKKFMAGEDAGDAEGRVAALPVPEKAKKPVKATVAPTADPGLATSVDSWRRIGLFIGGMPTTVKIQQDQLKSLLESERTHKEILSYLKTAL